MVPPTPRSIRPAVQAGRFYPARPTRLQSDLRDYLEQVEGGGGEVPKAVIAPHAGYDYSAVVAARAFVRLGPAHARLRRVVLVGPSHYEDFPGVAVTRVEAFATPLGEVPVDINAVANLLGMPGVVVSEEAHGPEHCLEVELPFLQTVLDRFCIVPLVVGQATRSEVRTILLRVWGGDETCVVVSSDLSHYLDHATATRRDRETAEALRSLRAEALGVDAACGHRAVAGLVEVARQRQMRVEVLDLRNSGDTAGPRDRVVGYGAFAFYEPGPAR